MKGAAAREAKDLSGDPETPGSPDSEAASAIVPPALLAEWRSAEDRLYPMIMVRPESYERVVRLVGETTVELQLACQDLASLVEESPRVADRVRRLADESVLGGHLDFALIGAAACLMRYRQLEAEMHREQRIRQIAAAVASGATWVVLERGAPPTSWPPMPTTTLEMHLASGWALEQTINIDGATGAPQFVLTEVELDPATGERQRGDLSEEEFDDLNEWRVAIDERRHKIESGH
jgi:hypothetical protein